MPVSLVCKRAAEELLLSRLRFKAGVELGEASCEIPDEGCSPFRIGMDSMLVDSTNVLEFENLVYEMSFVVRLMWIGNVLANLVSEAGN